MCVAVQKIIEKYFDSNDFDIVHDHYSKSYKVINKKQKQMCIELIYFKNSNCIEINHIKKCTLSGNEILNRIEILSKELNIEYISLKDWSHIEIEYENGLYNCDLIIMTILTNGYSWYNNHGYLSQSYEIELEKNSLKQQMKFKDFYEKAIENLFDFATNTWNTIIEEIKLTKNKTELIEKLHYYLSDEQKIIYSELNQKEIIEQFKKDIAIMLNEAKMKDLIVLEQFKLKGYDIENNVKDVIKQVSIFVRKFDDTILDQDDHLMILLKIFRMCYNNIDYDRIIKKKL